MKACSNTVHQHFTIGAWRYTCKSNVSTKLMVCTPNVHTVLSGMSLRQQTNWNESNWTECTKSAFYIKTNKLCFCAFVQVFIHLDLGAAFSVSKNYTFLVFRSGIALAQTFSCVGYIPVCKCLGWSFWWFVCLPHTCSLFNSAVSVTTTV
jgi:hypothetical protein